MADALEQTKDLFSVDDFNEDDISDKSKLIKALENPFGEFRPKEEIIEKAKATGTGLLTGTLGIPSDVATLASAVSSGMAKYADSPTAMMLKDVLKKARDDVGRPAFDKWFTETTGLESNPENVDQLVGEVLSPTGAFLAPVKTLKNIFAPLKKGVTDFFDKMPPPDSGLAVETAGVGQLDQTKNLLDKEKTFVADNVTTIPPEEFINTPKTTKMSMAGNRTPTGKKQIEKFRELDKTKKYNPDELFEKTGVYKGEDGKFRWEIDTSDAELKNLDTINNAKDEDAFVLSNLLKFDRLYQEYFEPIKVSRPSSVYKGQSARFNYKPMKNLSVVVKRGSDEDAGALASYSPASDRITIYPDRILSSALKSKNRYPDVSINDLYKYRLESSILHEVQHAIQGREGFVRGSNTENFLPKTYEQDIKTNNKLLDDSYVNFFDQFKAEDVLRTSKDRYDVDSASNSIKSIIGADLNNIKDPTIVNIAFRDAMSKLRDVNLRTPLKEKIVNGYIQRVQQHFQNKKIIDNEYDKAYGKYRDTYGEKEARLVQDRFEKRLNLKSQSSDIQDEMSKTKIPEDMMDTTRAEKERLSKLARTDPITGKVKRKVSIKNLAKGGDMNKQMEMFEDGGLKQEGGTIDPVSGNDVPPGSTQEEVRDDIPAQLSEGEFVFPADVVRYIGLEKLMRLRQEAKQGLKMMEEMGQMGNSEEATMPDDLPFDETDLDIEDEEEYNNDTQEMNQGGMVRVGGIEMPRPIIAGQQMAEGGVVKAQSGTFVNPGTGVTTVPSQFAGQNLPSYKPSQTIPSYTVPTIPGQTTDAFRPVFYGKPPADSKGITTPTFENLLGRNPGQYDEFREYKNDAGFTLRIPFRNGQPIYPIPEGFKFIDPEKEETETTTTQTTQTGTTQVSDSDGDTTGARVGTTMVGKTGKGVTDKSLSTAEKTANVISALEQNTPKSTLGKAIEAGAKGLMGAMMPGVGLLGGTALGAKSFFSPSSTSTQGLQGIGFTPDTAQGIGYDANGNVTVSGPMASVMGRAAVMDMLSQQAYGMSLADKAKELGLSLDEYSAIAFSKGYKNGQVDPTTGATYAYGQAVGDDGNVSYSSIDDFGISMGAMAETGFMGSLADVDRVVNSPTATKAQKMAAIKYKNMVQGKSKQKEQDKKDKEAADRGGTGDLGGIGDLGSGYGIGASTGTGSQNIGTEDVDPTGGGGQESNNNSDDGTGMGAGGEDAIYKGSLITKRKASGKVKPKYMKQGGLASKK